MSVSRDELHEALVRQNTVNLNLERRIATLEAAVARSKKVIDLMEELLAARLKAKEN